MKKSILGAIALLTLPATAWAQCRDAASGATKDGATLARAIQTSSDAILISSPLICFASQEEASTWTREALRLFRIPTAKDATTSGSQLGQVATEFTPDFEDADKRCFARIRMRSLDGALDPEGEYRILVSPREACNVMLDLKFDRPGAVPLSRFWTLGVDLGLEVATRDSSETNKLKLAYPFTHTWVFGLDGGSAGALYSRVTPTIEGDDIFANRNVLGDLSIELVSVALNGAFGQPGQMKKAEHLWKYSLTPRLGYQWGENQHLEDDELMAFEGYSVSRAAAQIELSLTRKLPYIANIRSVSCSLTYSAWYRFSRELDTFTDADGESAVRLDDGFDDYLTAAFDLGITEAFGLVLKYQTGERPVLFVDEDKASLGISYRL